jgi:hypothetical protein
VHSHTGIRSKWRRFNRKFGSKMFIGVIVLVILALVGLVLYGLNNPSWHAHE